ncbi:response regulator [Spirosoma flavum]|uniref:Response regulator n=1 Tax=Spirosoma flavum TaxID=2048557 RepID=A0ABW6AG06_9BACT
MAHWLKAYPNDKDHTFTHGHETGNFRDRKNLILIDDDEDDHCFFIAALKGQTYKIQCTRYLKPREALDKISQNRGPQPAYIFIDLNMPQLTGLECLRILKETPTLSAIPVIIYSTSSNSNDIETFKRLGAAAYLIKPASIDALTSRLSAFF